MNSALVQREDFDSEQRSLASKKEAGKGRREKNQFRNQIFISQEKQQVS